MLRDIEQDLADWFEITHKNESGGTGYPASCDLSKRTGKGQKKNTTPTAHMPSRLGTINRAMMRMYYDHEPMYKVFKVRHFEKCSDRDKAHGLKMSLDRFYRLCIQGKYFLMGAYAVK